MEVDEGSDQISDAQPQWIAVHACLKTEFTEGEKCHNLMSRLKLSIFSHGDNSRNYSLMIENNGTSVSEI